MKFYLEQFINVLHDADASKLKSMPLKRSKIKTFLDLLIDNRKTGLPEQEVFLNRLDLDENSYRKMKTILLGKCIEYLVPEGGVKRLEFLSRYRLSEIFMREVRDQLEVLNKNPGKFSVEEKKNIYRECFFGYMRLPFSMYDPDKMRSYRKGFYENNSAPERDITDAFLELNEIYAMMVKSYFSLDISAETYKFFKSRINAIEKKTEHANSVRINLFVRGMYAILEFYFKLVTDNLDQEFLAVISGYQKLNDSSVTDELFALKFYLAYQKKLTGDLTESMQLFSDLESEFPRHLYNSPYIVYRYSTALALAGERQKMKELLDKYMQRHLRSYDPDAYILSCVSYTIYHLLTNELHKVFEYIQVFRSMVDRKSMLSWDLLMRIFEIVYYYQRDDEEFAAAQLKKFVRYMNDRTDVKSMKLLIDLVKNLQKEFTHLNKGKISFQEFESSIHKYSIGKQAILISVLINAARIREMKNDNQVKELIEV